MQRADLAMWLHGDEELNSEESLSNRTVSLIVQEPTRTMQRKCLFVRSN